MGVSFKKIFGKKKRSSPPPPPPPPPSVPFEQDTISAVKASGSASSTKKILAQTATHMTIQTPDGTFNLQNLDGSGWMLDSDWSNWNHWKRKKEYRRAERHRVGYVARAKALMEGASLADANKAGGAFYGAAKSKQHKEARKKGFKKLQAKTTKILHTKGGMLLGVAGLVATVIPVIGWVAGPLITAAGGALTAAQQAKMAKKIAERRKKDLESAKARWENGEITDEEYQAIVEKIAGEEAPALLKEEFGAKGEESQETSQAERRSVKFEKATQAPSPQAPSKFPVTTVAIAGVATVAVIGIAAALAGRQH